MSLFRKKEKKQVAIEPDENLEEKMITIGCERSKETNDIIATCYENTHYFFQNGDLLFKGRLRDFPFNVYEDENGAFSTKRDGRIVMGPDMPKPIVANDPRVYVKII